MTHLSTTQLSAHLDHALGGRAAEEAERHLAACESCRMALAALAAQDEALQPALTHVPDEAYFERFPARVEDRLRAAGLAGAQSRGPGFGLGNLFSPRGLAWAGAAATVVVGAGLALMTMREVRPPELRDREIPRGLPERVAPPAPGAPRPNEAPAPTGSVRQEGPPPSPSAIGAEGAGSEGDATTESRTRPSLAEAPGSDRKRLDALARERSALSSQAGGQEPRRDRRAATPPGAALTPSAPTEGRRPSLGRATPVQRNEAGEDVPVRRPGEPRFAQPPPPSGANDEDQAVRIRKKLLAEPMKDVRTWGSTKSLYRADSSSAHSFASPKVEAPGAATGAALVSEGVAVAEGRLCGEVLDAAGRPVAGAHVVVADIGRTTTTDARGGFCITAPMGEHPLSVMAVGYSESRQAVRVGGEQAAVRVFLAAVPVIEGGGMAAERPIPKRSAATTNVVGDRYSGLSDTVQSVVRDAQRLGSDAAARRSAALFDASAGTWQRALRRLAGGPLELETRWHLAEARYRAWESGPNNRRASAAIEALTAYVARAPASPERAQATRWLDRVKR